MKGRRQLRRVAMPRVSAFARRQPAACEVRDLGVPAVAGGAANRPRAQRDADPPRRVTRRPPERGGRGEAEPRPEGRGAARWRKADAQSHARRAGAMRPPVFTDAERTRTLAAACARSVDGIEFAGGSLT